MAGAAALQGLAVVVHRRVEHALCITAHALAPIAIRMRRRERKGTLVGKRRIRVSAAGHVRQTRSLERRQVQWVEIAARWKCAMARWGQPSSYSATPYA